MKDEYVSPNVVNYDAHEFLGADGKSDGAAPALLLGYAAARMVTKAVKAAPSLKLPAINER